MGKTRSRIEALKDVRYNPSFLLMLDFSFSEKYFSLVLIFISISIVQEYNKTWLKLCFIIPFKKGWGVSLRLKKKEKQVAKSIFEVNEVNIIRGKSHWKNLN